MTKNDDENALGADAAAGGNDTTVAAPERQVFTPGPWQVSSLFIVCDKDARILANCLHTGIPVLDVAFDQRVANAHLIAAAPDLYEALTDLWLWASERRTHSDTDPVPDGLGAHVMAAIAKAEGHP